MANESEAATSEIPAAKAHITSLRFASGTELKLKEDSILLIIGPNNAGKSQSLRDILHLLRSSGAADTKSIKSVSVHKSGNDEALQQVIKDRAFVRDGALYFAGGGSISPPSAVASAFKREGLGEAAPLFAALVTAEARIKATQPANRIALSHEAPTSPIHALEKDGKREKTLSKLLQKIFDTEIALNRNNGRTVPIHVGARPDSNKMPELSLDFSAEVAKLPTISEQGDGMIAFLGLLLYISGWPRDIYLIDEPDVYLHPPQAYAAAKIIAEEAKGKQLILATHNAHFLRGALAANRDRVSLVRLDRSGGTQIAKAVNIDAFETAKAEPIIRFTPILEAAFYQHVVVCEDEADCLFYRALLEANGHLSETSPVFWLSAHGKQNIKKLAHVLKSLGVHVISLADFDLINDETVLRSLIQAHEGAWSQFDENFKTVSASIKNKKPTVAAGDVKIEITKLISQIADGSQELFEDEYEKKLRDILRRASPWREIKSSGISAIDSGAPTQSARNLVRDLKSIGIVLPEIGEMESFYRDISAHGMAWVDQMLKKDLKNDPELVAAREFAKVLASSLAT